MPESLVNPALTGPSPESAPDESQSAPRCVTCGIALPVQKGAGRRRLTCSDRCRRLKDFRDRKVKRRLALIALWQSQIGHYPREFVRRAVRRVRDEIRDIKRAPQRLDG